MVYLPLTTSGQKWIVSIPNIVPDMTYNVFGGTLNPTLLLLPIKSGSQSPNGAYNCYYYHQHCTHLLSRSGLMPSTHTKAFWLLLTMIR